MAQFPTDARSPGAGDDGRERTRLAEERTYLAWLRSGLAAFAVALGAGKVVPVLTHATTWPYTVLGCAFAVVGVVLVGYGLVRHRAAEHAMAAGRFAPPDERVVAVLAVALMLLGVAVVAVVSFA